MDWINENILPLPLWAVGLTLFMSIVSTLALFFWAVGVEKAWKRLFIIPLDIVTACILISLIVWLSIASNGKEIDFTEDCEVTIVVFPSGKTAQMFYAAGVNHNANEMFGLMVPEDSVVRHFIYKKTYCGIYYTDPRDWLRDTYNIVKRGNDEQPPINPRRKSR